jgi:sulfur relay (sulfurtransferase) complex TusBCD TusD component (DsrE family)
MASHAGSTTARSRAFVWGSSARGRTVSQAERSANVPISDPATALRTADGVRAAYDYSLVGMKIAYVFSTSGHTASYKLGRMILPQLEQGTHRVEVVGMFFFDDNTYVLRAGDPVGERLGRVAAEHGMLLMLCDQCALERGLAEGEIGAAVPAGTVAGVRVGCFPDLYEALAGDPPDHVITL